MSFDRLGDHRRQQAQDLFRLGRTCVKTGDKAQGRELLLKAVEIFTLLVVLTPAFWRQ